jgi:4-diphosphocytidyl-2-C-methyl-D-erythritol kinase
MHSGAPTLTANAYAKINWDLHVLGRRPDGFHELDTVMVNVSLHDVLEFESATEITLTCNDPALPTDDKNLVVRAAKLLARVSGVQSGARIKLTKHIPAGGGMGGGSSDAACTLQSLNKLWGINWSVDRLQGLAAELGSDVAFFLFGGWARCRSRGEIVEPLDIVSHHMRLLVVFPPWPVATPSVYKRLNLPMWDGKSQLRSLTETSSSIKSLLNCIETGKFSQLGLSNELTDPALQVEPRLAKLQRVLEQLYPGRWLMSGSGSVHFVVPLESETEQNLKETLTSDLGVGIRVHTTTTFTS